MFCKSKYVEANPLNSFSECKKLLDDDNYVLFSGTPCMINGLKNYLGNDYSKLYTVDFACHGQGSPLVFKKWIEYLSLKYKKTLIHYEFREKVIQKDHINSQCVCYTFEDGTKKIVTRDYYLHAYINGLCMRKSCENCIFASNRGADITLADFKRQTDEIPFYEEYRNLSTIVTHNSKGEHLLSNITNLTFYKANVSYIEKNNPKLLMLLPHNKYRDNFMKLAISNKPIDSIMKKYSRIIPTELLEFNTSKKIYNVFYPLFRMFDYLYFLFRKIRIIIQKE